MRKLFPKTFPTKFLAVALSGLLFVTNCVLAGSLESNLWKERRNNLENASRKPTQLAALPSAMTGGALNPQNLLREFPALGKALNTVTDSQSNNTQLKLPSSVAPFIKAIPLNSGTVKDIYLGNNTQSGNKPMVVLIQDVHLNNEAQQNIANILLALNDTASLLTPQQPMTVGSA